MMRLAVYGQDEGGNQVNELSWWLLQKNKCKRMRVLRVRILILLHLLVSQSHHANAGVASGSGGKDWWDLPSG